MSIATVLFTAPTTLGGNTIFVKKDETESLHISAAENTSKQAKSTFYS
jgi:hypothetical protein